MYQFQGVHARYTDGGFHLMLPCKIDPFLECAMHCVQPLLAAEAFVGSLAGEGLNTIAIIVLAGGFPFRILQPHSMYALIHVGKLRSRPRMIFTIFFVFPLVLGDENRLSLYGPCARHTARVNRLLVPIEGGIAAHLFLFTCTARAAGIDNFAVVVLFNV